MCVYDKGEKKELTRRLRDPSYSKACSSAGSGKNPDVPCQEIATVKKTTRKSNGSREKGGRGNQVSNCHDGEQKKKCSKKIKNHKSQKAYFSYIEGVSSSGNKKGIREVPFAKPGEKPEGSISFGKEMAPPGSKQKNKK